MSDEKRRFTRIPFRVSVEMTVEEASYAADQINNLSIGGCLLPITADLEAGADCRLSIMLTGASSELSVRINGNVVRCDPDVVAVKFTSVDPDSLYHLQNIIRYNAPDEEAVEQEIIGHPGLV